MNCKTLYRPVGWKELELIRKSGWTAFPQRLEWQPIFYPVLNQAYAEQIANEWNTEDAFSGYCGIVTAFDLPVAYLDQFEMQHVGGAGHDELWIPAEVLPEFNAQIRGGIRIIAAFTGSKFERNEEDELMKVIKPFIG
jgi:hypothetical protein